ncbi:MAG: UDP-N-acetylmuramoyl-L-alanine--D-glutamate ligase [Betaproteobacteria bacterium]|nr:UDP-N-acetylmuramoyl-L-alanine--D-glutamate ligase [Betaproteobacteria bacterium]
MMELAGKQTLVLGLGMTGMSMVRWLKAAGAHVRVADTRPNPPSAEHLRAQYPDVSLACGPFSPPSFEGVDLLAVSPGVPVSEPLVRKSSAAGVTVVGDVEFFARAQPAMAPAPVLAITGSNGKSTVTELAGAMCRNAGLNTVVAGNIGIPVLDALAQARTSTPGVFVLELSSFQLETTASLNAAAATCLNVSEDHMDRYDGMADYAAAKERVFRGTGVQVINRQDPLCASMAQPGRQIFSFGLDTPRGPGELGIYTDQSAAWLAEGERRLFPVSGMGLAGMHNAANALAALALCRGIGIPYEPLLATLRQFKGLPHRVQKIAEVKGVSFFDDSKGTNVGATVAALSGFTQPTVLIAGGDGKGQEFSPLQKPVRDRARAVVLIGRDAARIESALQGSGVPLMRALTMEEAVAVAFEAAREGDAVLLSPACASFDMFRNYEHRAQVFAEAVRRLEAR